MGLFNFFKGGDNTPRTMNLYAKPAKSGRRDDWRWFDSVEDIPKKGVWIIDPNPTGFKKPVKGYKPKHKEGYFYGR